MLPGSETATGALATGGINTVEVDQRIFLYSVSWERYQALRALLDDVAGLRMTYLEGTLEIMSPSRTHECVKSLVSRLVEMYAAERDIPLYCYGSMTFRKEARERGLEPDECYAVGTDMRDFPDIAFEVEVTGGGLDKLSVYLGLGVPEVWLWRGGRILIHELVDGGYQPRERSPHLPELDVAALASLSNAADQVAAVRAWRDLLRKGG